MRLLSAGTLLFASALAFPAQAQLQHGSGRGDGDSRGPGKGDGMGYERETGQPKPARDEPPAGDESAKQKAPPKERTIFDSVSFTPMMQYRVRYYHQEHRDFAPGASNYVRHRARLGLDATYDDTVGVLIQLQDVRSWGEESDVVGDFSADGFDVHQAYAHFHPSPAVELRLGRQVIGIVNERLVGGLNFAEQARSFDAARFTYDADGTRFDAAYALVRKPADDPDGPGFLPEGHTHLATLHVGHVVNPAFAPQVIGVFEADTRRDLSRITFGPLFQGKAQPGERLAFDYSAEGYLQAGGEDEPETQDAPINYLAWLVALRARLTGGRFFKPYVEVGGTLISGDADPDDDTQRVFRSPYPTGHKYHGEMDFFIVFPRDTRQRGLRDLYAEVGWGTKRVASSVAFHFFDPMSDAAGLSHFGYELDFKLSYQFWRYAAVSGAYAFFSPGDIFRSGIDDVGLEHFGYATVDVQF